MAVTKEQALALAKARRRRAEAGQQQPQQSAALPADRNQNDYRGSTVDRFIRGLGAGAADLVGAPADLMNWGLGLVGQDVEKPWLGSENIEGLLAKVSMAPEEGVDQEAEDTWAGAIGQGFGMAGATLVPMFGATRLASASGAASRALTPSSSSTGRRVADTVVEGIRKNPIASAVSEVGGNVGATTARKGGREAGLEPGSPQDLALQLAGGGLGAFAPGAAVSAGRLASKISNVSLVKPVVKGTLGRYRRYKGKGFDDATMDTAATRIQSQAADLNKARSNLVNQSTAEEGLTPAQVTDDAGIMAVENRVNQANPAMQEAAEAQRKAMGAKTEGVFTGLGDDVPVSRAGEELVRRRSEFAKRMDDRVQSAKAKADEAAQSLGPARAQGEVSAQFKDDLSKAYRESSDEVQQLWKRVDKTLPASADNTMAAFKQATQDIGEAGRVFGGDVPGPLARLMNQAPQDGQPLVTNVGELQELRRILGERAAAFGSGANPDRYRQRIMNNMVKAIDEDFGAVANTGKVIGKEGDVPIKEAIAATRQLSQRFRQDDIASVLARSGTGGERVAAEQALAKLIPMGAQGSSTRGLAGARQIEKAITESQGPVGGFSLPANSAAPAIRQGVEDYLQGEFQRRAMPNGQVDPAAARKFLFNNDETLKLPQFRDLRTRLQNVADAARKGQVSQERVAKLMDNMTDPRQSRAAMFLGKDTADGTYQNALSNVLKGDAYANMRELVKQVRKDPTGDALKGLKTGYSRELLSRVRGDGGLPDGEKLLDILSGAKTLGNQDAALGRAAQAIFTPDELKNLRNVADAARKLSKSANTAPTPGNVPLGDDAIGGITRFLAQITGANIGAKFGQGSASIQAANLGSKYAQNIVSKIAESPVETVIADAMSDPKLFKDLLLRNPPTTGGAMGNISIDDRVLGAWLMQLPMHANPEAEQPVAE